MDLSAIGYLDPVKTIELRYQGVGVLSDVGIVLSQYFPQQFVFSLMYSFDNVLVVPGEVEKASTFAG